MKRFRLLLAAVQIGAFIALLALHFYPIRSGPIKLLMVASVLSLALGAPMWFSKHSIRLAILIAFLLVAAAFVFIPGSYARKQSQVRDEYVLGLRRFEGVPYVWGGETGRGVDCSGIIRAAWIDTQRRMGSRSLNLALLRSSFFDWWFDASAKELGSGFRGRTLELHTAKSIRANRDKQLQPGDFAIVASGTHALAYLGNHEWIQADPGAQKVIIVTTDHKNAWLDAPAVFMRWRALE